MDSNQFIPYGKKDFSESEMQEKARAFYADMMQRRSIREFSSRPVPREVIENIIMTASSAPSGAHKQPWTFCVVESQAIKAAIREAAEAEEHTNYNGRMSEEWIEDLKQFGTDWQKPFLEVAPYLIVIFRKSYDITADGKQHKNYYVSESVGIAAGFLLAAIHHAGLVTLTHTPSPMNFLQKILNRPENEKPYLLLPVGYPAEDATVPNILRKQKDEVMIWY